MAGKEEFAYSLGCFAYVKICLRLTITRYVYDLSAVQLEIEQGILSHQAKVMQKCILHINSF